MNRRYERGGVGGKSTWLELSAPIIYRSYKKLKGAIPLLGTLIRLLALRIRIKQLPGFLACVLVYPPTGKYGTYYSDYIAIIL